MDDLEKMEDEDLQFVSKLWLEQKERYNAPNWERRRWNLVSDLTKAVFGKEKFNLEKYQTSWELDADCIVSQVDAIIERYRRG